MSKNKLYIEREKKIYYGNNIATTCFYNPKKKKTEVVVTLRI